MRSHEKQSFLLVDFCPNFWVLISSDLGHLFLVDDWDSLEGVDLLGDQRFGWGEEEDLPQGKPLIEVQYNIRGNEGLPESSGETDQSVFKKSLLGNVELIPPEFALIQIVPSLLGFSEFPVFIDFVNSNWN